MRTIHQLVHTRARVRQRYALMPLEGVPDSRLPTWPDARVRVLASPALGAQFVQYLIDLPANKRGGFDADPRLETFYYVVSGTARFGPVKLSQGSFGLIEPGKSGLFEANESLRLLLLRKVFEPAACVPAFKGFNGHVSSVKAQVWADNPHSLLQTLIPDDLGYDLAMNIFTFDPGFGLPVVETHVMEHGLFFLQGKGLYYLEDEWMEVEADDFIWMGPYCPQSFYATGPTPSRYLYYKNVNRDVRL